jgi:hypothetical protein
MILVFQRPGTAQACVSFCLRKVVAMQIHQVLNAKRLFAFQAAFVPKPSTTATLLKVFTTHPGWTLSPGVSDRKSSDKLEPHAHEVSLAQTVHNRRWVANCLLYNYLQILPPGQGLSQNSYVMKH